ncbi:MAG: hypothetical protein LBB91_05685 [Clostridiales bacterium]|jgi:hypothetical protein|nr:hypothetical protein [Clostridiales bacterium]
MKIIFLFLLLSLIITWICWLCRPQSPRVMPTPVYLLVEQKIPTIEWLIRDVCAYSDNFELFVVDRVGGETRTILERLSRRYNFSLLNSLPPEAAHVLLLDKPLDPAQLRFRLSQLLLTPN